MLLKMFILMKIWYNDAENFIMLYFLMCAQISYCRFDRVSCLCLCHHGYFNRRFTNVFNFGLIILSDSFASSLENC